MHIPIIIHLRDTEASRNCWFGFLSVDLALLGIGLAVGTGLALIAGGAASTLLFGLRASDPSTLMLAATSPAAVAAGASFLPAQRASTLDPMQALREE